MLLGFTHHQGWHYDLSKSLNGVDNLKAKPAVVLHANDIVSFLSASYVFEYPEGNVGEHCSSQFAVTSNALATAAPITMSEFTHNGGPASFPGLPSICG